MKILNLLFILAVLLASCGSPTREDQSGSDDSDSLSANQVLYDQVMEIHDEVMPKMGEIESLKRTLQEQINATPEMAAEERAKLEQRIAHLDSAGTLMMDWMHTFSPLPDSLGQEAARDYLESEMEKIKKVREAILEAIASEKRGN